MLRLAYFTWLDTTGRSYIFWNNRLYSAGLKKRPLNSTALIMQIKNHAKYRRIRKPVTFFLRSK